MVREIVSVAELYSGGPAWDDDEKALRRRASGIVRRGRAWLDVYDT
jgi:hypothetical protein